MSKFKIGDLVKIGEVRGSNSSTSEMYDYKDCVGRITARHSEQKYQDLVQVEGADDWWFSEDILVPVIDNRKYINAFLKGMKIEIEVEPGLWTRMSILIPEYSGLRMRFSKRDEYLAIEKDIDALRAELDDLAIQKRDIDRKCCSIKSMIARRAKKLDSLNEFSN